MTESQLKNNSVIEMVAPMIAITSELDAINGELLHKNFGVSLADFKVLRAVHILTSCTQLDIARFNHVTEAAVSKRVKSLVNESFLAKQSSTHDKRASVIVLTADGKKLMNKLQQVVVGNMESMLSTLSEEKRAQASELLMEVLRCVVDQSPRKDMILQSKHPMLAKAHVCN